MATGNYLKTFVGDDTYTFPTTQSQIRDNFSNQLPKTVRVPGVDGGFDQFGEEKAPVEIGNVTVTFEQYADTDDDLQSKIDELRVTESWGVGTLTKQCGSLGERWTKARVNSVVRTEDRGNNGGMKFLATVNFQAAEPYWFKDGTWGSDFSDWSDAVSLTNIGTTSGDVTSTQMATSVGGLFRTYPKIAVYTTVGNMTAVGIKRTDDIYEPEESIGNADIYITGLNTNTLVIDCETMSVRYGSGADGSLAAGTEAFSLVSSYKYPNFVSLKPGTGNWFKLWVVGGTTPIVKVAWKERY